MKTSPGSRPKRNGSRPPNVSSSPKAARANPSTISMRPRGAMPSVWHPERHTEPVEECTACTALFGSRLCSGLREDAAAVQAQQDLHQPVRNQLVQGEQLLISLRDGVRVAGVAYAAAGLER